MRPTPLILTTLLLAACAGGTTVRSDADTPEQAVTSAFRAFQERRWQDAALLFDVTILDGVYEDALSAAKRYREEPQTLAEYRRARPELPEPVALYMWEQYKQHIESRGTSLGHRFPGIRSADELEQLSREELMARWLQDADPREMARRQANAQGAEQPPDHVLGVPLNPVILGVVTEEPDLAHVVYRLLHDHGEDPDDSALASTTTLRHTDDGWRLLDRHLFSPGGWFGY
jgi:hypothetical protein